MAAYQGFVFCLYKVGCHIDYWHLLRFGHCAAWDWWGNCNFWGCCNLLDSGEQFISYIAFEDWITCFVLEGDY